MIELTIDGAVAQVVLNARAKRNALDETAIGELSRAYDDA